MKTKLTGLLLFSLLNLLSLSSVKATHLAGGNITYSCVSGNTYQIKVTLFRDCKGVALSIPTLTVSGCGNTIAVNYTGAIVTPVLVITPCNATVKTACDVPAGTAPGIQRYDFNFTYTLAAALAVCNDVTFSYDVCCRNNAITTLSSAGNQNIRIEAHLNPVTASCNNSPSFPNQANLYPAMFLCLNQQNCFNYAVTEMDGDSISYDWMTPLQLNGALAIYNVGFDSAHCITGTQTINKTNGDICMTPTAAGQVAVIAMKITEWRRINGVMTKIGWVERDIQLYMIACANNLPSISGINGTNSYTTQICAGSKICFDIFSNDPDNSDSLKLTSSNSPAFVFTVSGSKHQIGHYCLATTAADTGKVYNCTATVKDNACPQPGVRSAVYQVNVIAGTFYPTIYFMNDTIRCTYTSGTTYQWYFNGSPKGGNNSYIPFDSTGSYTVNVIDSNGCSGISNTVAFTVGMPSLQNEKSVTIFPNPFNHTTTITLNNSSPLTNTQFTLSNIFGRNVMSKKMEKNELVIERGNLVEGIYFYSIHDNDKIIAAGKILIVE